MKFALFFGNRGFMPAELIAGARADMIKAVEDAGHEALVMTERATRYGAVETREEGKLYHDWLKSHEGEYDGVILCMPIFIDENGAVTALQDAGTPILMQAYPDEIGKMDFQRRRDAFCGKFSVTDVFYQYRIPFTVFKPHVVHPLSAAFRSNLEDFSAVCRIVKGMKRFNIGCIGARTTAFKTVRFDELTLQRYGINVESFDLSELIFAVQHKKDDDTAVVERVKRLEQYTDFSKVPEKNKYTLARSVAGMRWKRFCAFVPVYFCLSSTIGESLLPAKSISVPPSRCAPWLWHPKNLRHASIGTIITERRKIRLYFSIVGPSRRA